MLHHIKNLTHVKKQNSTFLITFAATNNNFDPVIYDLDRYKVDAIFDCAYPMVVKNAIIDMVDFRGDMVFLADLGVGLSNLDSVLETADQITKSKYVAIYHNSFNIIDDFTKKEITVTMP